MEITKYNPYEIQNANDAGLMLEQITVQIEQTEKEIKPIKDKLSDLKNTKEIVLEKIKDIMYEEKMKELQTDNFKFKLVANPPKVNILDESKIPANYKKIKEVVTVDKKAIMQEWKDNEIEIEGTEITRDFRVKVEPIF